MCQSVYVYVKLLCVQSCVYISRCVCVCVPIVESVPCLGVCVCVSRCVRNIFPYSSWYYHISVMFFIIVMFYSRNDV